MHINARRKAPIEDSLAFSRFLLELWLLSRPLSVKMAGGYLELWKLSK